MPRFDGTLARTLDFGEMAPAEAGQTRRGLRLAAAGSRLRGPGKYKVLDMRRRRAQITARRVLDLIEAAERGTEVR